MNPTKHKYLKEEIQYLLNNDFIEPSQSEWSSPCILVPKPNRTYHMCTDYRKVNSLSKTDTFPIPRMDNSTDKIGNSNYITKFDLLKGFLQIPLTERAKEISAFDTPDRLYHYKVMPYGMKNSPATFQRLINTIIAKIEHCEDYMDDATIYKDEWNHHLLVWPVITENSVIIFLLLLSHWLIYLVKERGLNGTEFARMPLIN